MIRKDLIEKIGADIIFGSTESRGWEDYVKLSGDEQNILLTALACEWLQIINHQLEAMIEGDVEGVKFYSECSCRINKFITFIEK